MEALRPYIAGEQCFMAHKDPELAPITMEELKKLARAWKLHERRNFWKINASKDVMVATLLQHISDNVVQVRETVEMAHVPDSKLYQPAPPQSHKPSSQSISFTNYCGKFYFNRECSTKELISQARFKTAPKPADSVKNLVDGWRGADFTSVHKNSKDQQNDSNSSSDGPELQSQDEMNDQKLKIQKQRNLSAHLVQFSASLDNQKNALTKKDLEVFLAISDSKDFQTVCNCIIAISNVCSSAHVRAILLDMNAVHKIAIMLSMLGGKLAEEDREINAKAFWAAGLLFYYFSLEHDIEDRIYTVSAGLLKTNGSESHEVNYALTMLSLYTLNNLLPCIERQRVAEQILEIAMPFFASSNGGVILREHSILLDILQNICFYVNTHSTLLEHGVLDMLAMVASAAAAHTDKVIGRKIVQVLSTFMQSPDLFDPENDATRADDYICIFIDLLTLEDEDVVTGSFRILAVMSSMESLLENVSDPDVVRVVCGVITERTVSVAAATEAAKYFANICSTKVEAYSNKLMKDGAADAIIRLIQAPYPADQIAVIALKGLQNLLQYKSTSLALVEQVWAPLLYLIEESNLVDAAYCLFNVTCVPECVEVLVEHKLHSKILALMVETKDSKSRSSFVQILVQLCGQRRCVEDLLLENVIEKSNTAIFSASSASAMSSSLWVDISQMLLALVANKSDMVDSHRSGIVKILTKICVEGADETVLNNCAKILAYLSLNISSFAEMDPVIGSILTLSDNDIVLESISIVLYNVSCSEEQALMLLKSKNTYLNIMIRMMRSGKPQVQENVANGMRSLCALPNCTSILLAEAGGKGGNLLSDFIVIALLRTSSEAIKSVCSESFFNLLCHQEHRQKLLQGDLWWAMMRLSRSNNQVVRAVCAKTLFNLACDPRNMQPLRNNNVLALVKEISSTGSAEFLLMCLEAVENIVSQFEDHLSEIEVSSVIRICYDVLSRCNSPECQHNTTAINLLLRCALQCASENSIPEFNKVDIPTIINSTRLRWCNSPECCVNVAQLTRAVSRSETYTKATSLHDIEETLLAVFYDGAPLLVYECVTECVLQYICHRQIEASAVVKQRVWARLLEQNCFSEEAAAEARTSQRLRICMLSIVAFVFEYSLANRNVGTSVPFEVIRDIFRSPDIILDPLVQENLMFIIFQCSLDEDLGGYMLRAGVCTVLVTLINSCTVGQLAKTNAGEFYNDAEKAAQEENRHQVKNATEIRHRCVNYCSAVVRNMSLCPALLPLLIEAVDIDILVGLITESALPSVAMDMATLLYFSSGNKQLKHDAPLCPNLVLETITCITKFAPKISSAHLYADQGLEGSPTLQSDDIISKITKHIIGIVLDDYAMGAGVHPSFIQSMYTEIQDRSSAEIPTFMLSVHPITSLPKVGIKLPHELINEKVVATYPAFVEKETQWNHILVNEKKAMRADFYSHAKADPLVYGERQMVEMGESPELNKIVKVYAFVSRDSQDN